MAPVIFSSSKLKHGTGETAAAESRNEIVKYGGNPAFKFSKS